MLPLLVLMIPSLTGLLCFILKHKQIIEWVHCIGSTLTSLATLLLVRQVVLGGTLIHGAGFFYIDALSAIVIAIIAIVGLTAALHSIGYIRHELKEGVIDHAQFRHYYFWYHLFIATMLMACVVNNLGLLWVGIEATTIVSAFLVALYRKGEALEAAWKYLMICSVGIAFALLGLIILYISSMETVGVAENILNWSALKDPHIHLHPSLVSLSFVFLMIGLGTKVGLAPMHFWLPDAHCQAPSPVSSVLSGVLLNCALLGLIRFSIIAENTLGHELIQHLFISFGLLSIIIAFPFIIVQQDMKRMLAFSTVEHMGIIAVAIGLGGILGFSAALLQMINHSMAKSMLFLAAGNIYQKYRTKQMARVAGVLGNMPVTGILFLVGTLAITGVPPFNIFTSEFSIITAGFTGGHPFATSFLLVFLTLIFGAMVFHISKMSFGSSKDKIVGGELSRWSILPLMVPFAFVLVFGLYVPSSVTELIHQAALIMTGGRIS
jgi:hydrogenase-4 component F